MFKDLYFNLKCSFLCFSISFLMVFARLLNVCLSEGSLFFANESDLCASLRLVFLYLMAKGGGDLICVVFEDLEYSMSFAHLFVSY